MKDECSGEYYLKELIVNEQFHYFCTGLRNATTVNNGYAS
jgi:hypothetical protein